MRVRIQAIAIAASLAGCTPVNGGAVELSWTLRPASSSMTDKFVGCDLEPMFNPIAQIRLDWDVGGVLGSRSWSCTDNQGVTEFELPEGDALLSVEPVCESDVVPPSPTFTAPAPELRTIRSGDTVTLGAIELVVQVAYCDQQPCICQSAKLGE